MKVTVGLIFIAAMFGDDEAEIGTIVTGCVIGLALIAWGIIPFVLEKKEQKKAEEKLAAIEEKRRLELEAQMKAEAEKPKYCSKCGASTKGSVCEYCGSPLDD